MTAVVHFRAGRGDWALDVRDVRQVLPARELRPLPEPWPGVAGLLEVAGAGSPLPVLTAPGAAAGRHILVLETRGRRFGLLVDEVAAVLRDEQVRMGPAPRGEHAAMVRATVTVATGTALLLDAGVLGERL